jgi:hypothetical protein
MSLNNKEFIIWKERGGGQARRQVSRQAYLRLG